MTPNCFRSCVVCGKNKKIDNTLKFHYFPRNRKRCKEWVEILNIGYLKTKPLEQLSSTYVVCSNHFSQAFYAANGRLLSTATPVRQASLMNVVGTGLKEDGTQILQTYTNSGGKGISSIDANSNPKTVDHLVPVPVLDPFTSGFGLLRYSTDEAGDIGLQRDRDKISPDRMPPPANTELLLSHTAVTPMVEVILKEEPGGSVTTDNESTVFIKEEPTFKEEPQEWDEEPKQCDMRHEKVMNSAMSEKEQKISVEGLESCSSNKGIPDLCKKDEVQSNCGDSDHDNTEEYLPAQDDDAEMSHDLTLEHENIMAEQRANAAHVIKERERIIGLFKSGLSVRGISQTLGIHRSTVYKWVNRWQKDRSLKTKPRSGRPRVTTREEDKAIVERALQQPFATAEQITQDLHLNCSPLTTRKRLHSSNIHHLNQGHP